MSFRFKCGLFLVLAQISISVADSSPFGEKCSDICGVTTDVPRATNTKYRLHKRSVEEETAADEDEYVDEGEYDEDGTDISDDDARIVNGYKAKNRPWLVLMLPRGGLCGGVLINNLFVLSAAHCYCRMDNTPIRCKEGVVNGKPTSIPEYDVTAMVTMHIGVNGKKMDSVKNDPSLTYNPVQVWIREGWVIGKGFSPDLSLAKLNRPVKFAPNVVAPICMPTEEITDKALKEKMPVFVAGWGAQFSACDTNDSGPSPNTMCKFPFEHNGKMHNYCVHEPTPAETDPVCKEFFEWSKGVNMLIKRSNEGGAAVPVKVEYEKGKHKYCFDTNHISQGGEMGWCGTCYHGVTQPGQEGEVGFCNPFDPMRPPLPTETSKPTTSENWGMCASWCRPNATQSAAQELMETGLELLDSEICNKLGADLVFDGTREICAGHKKFFPVIDVFKKTSCKKNKRRMRRRNRRRRNRRNRRRRTKRSTGQSCYSKQKNTGEIYNYGIDSPFDFYLGGSDSCQGDSGGPLIAFMKNEESMRGFTLGAVSRGTGCANLNAPGIFTRVSHHLEWVKEIAGEGTC